jgi:uncharacterized protein YprB with RNaseH-like and TPR domain
MPAARPADEEGSNAERLKNLLGGESRTNGFGNHICVRCRYPEPKPEAISARALQLIAPDSSESAGDIRQWLFLDTETTGLAGGTGTYAFLVGVGWWEDDGFIVEQYFMKDHGDERSLLLEVLDRLNQRSVLVTFNGKSFDWPLLQTRFQMARIRPVPQLLAHLDLLHPARQIWRLSLKSVALAQLEHHVLQIRRGHDIPSETIPQRYFDFLRGGSAEAMAEVFRHNQLDICGLASLSLRISTILADPESGVCGAGELFGISRMMQRRGDCTSAERIYQKALAVGLPEAAEQVARRELAFLAKRERNFELSNAHWEKLIGGSIEGLKAYEQLAIYYEHHVAQPQKAAALSREALIRLQESFHSGRVPLQKYQQWHASFQHRLSRLTAKITKQPNGSPPMP